MRFLLVIAPILLIATVIAQQTVSPCSMCGYVIAQAQRHFKQSDNKDQVQKELLKDCDSLRRFYGDQAVTDCDTWVTQNIDVIYNDLENDKSVNEICADMGECGSPRTTPKAKAREQK